MDGPDVPSPLPFVISILPLLLSASDVALPASTLASSVLQRHYYLAASPDSPATYLQATADASVQDAVERRREALASTWLEDVKPSGVLYSATIHEEQKLVARITLGIAGPSSTSLDSHTDDSSLVLLVVYEEASPSDRPTGSSGEPGPSSLATPAQAEEEAEESGWKYYDLQLPQSKSNLNTSAWHPSVQDARAALARITSTHTPTVTGHNRSTSVSTIKATTATTTKKRTTQAQKALLEKQREADIARGLQVEEGPDQDPDDYWAGCESSDDDPGNQRENGDSSLDEENEDDYWNNYGQHSPGNAGSIVDSGHHDIDQPPEDDYTMRYIHDKTHPIGHVEQVQDLFSNSDTPHGADYSFDSEPGAEDMPVQGGRILVDESDLRDSRNTDIFLSTLQSSLERVSSSQSESQSDNDDQQAGGDHALRNGRRMRVTGNGNGNGHSYQGGRPASPTIDSAISKSIAGLWETYLLSSALGGGGKSREIAAYEFMELVQNVVQGENI